MWVQTPRGTQQTLALSKPGHSLKLCAGTIYTHFSDTEALKSQSPGQVAGTTVLVISCRLQLVSVDTEGLQYRRNVYQQQYHCNKVRSVRTAVVYAAVLCSMQVLLALSSLFSLPLLIAYHLHTSSYAKCG
jgi:hypothetical protein